MINSLQQTNKFFVLGAQILNDLSSNVETIYYQNIKWEHVQKGEKTDDNIHHKV